uniref:Putative acetylornithine deacetylase n=1 Tax=Trypanosoma congolense (strain IL3000) TaxID=1068625 RepID=G0URF5_TRYCI|nr:putative acetylornithine deacetylase [Trypanosoma congolense IL3000]
MNYKRWLEKLVSYDTTSRNSNLELIHYVKTYLEGVGVDCILIHNEEKTKANLWATLPGENGVTEGGTIFSGHTDVVPVDGQEWFTDPFILTERDGKLYGRGTCDMKGFIAVCMSLTQELLQVRREKPIHFAWTYDEEVGCIGGQVLTTFLREKGIKVDGCIVGEPTSNKIVVAHKGIAVYRMRVRGIAAHSSYALTSQSCNAVDYAARLVVKIREIAEDVARHGARDRFFDVPHTTISTNIVTGGNAENTVPALCEFVFEIRFLTSAEQDMLEKRICTFVDAELLPAMKRESASANIELRKVASAPSFSQADEKGTFLPVLRSLTGDTAIRKVAYATEAGQYQNLGIPVTVCGPGSILQAHQANEFVTVEQLAECAGIIRGVVQGCCALLEPHL